MYAPSEMCREVREEDVESRYGNNEEEEEEEEDAVLYFFLHCWGEVESVTLVSVTVGEAFLWSTEWVLFTEDTDDTLCIGRPSLREEARSTEECWMEAEDKEATEGDLDSFTEDMEAVEFSLTDRVLSAESKEDMEEDTEEVSWAGVSWEEVLEEGVRWGEAATSVECFWSFPFEELRDGEQEDATGGDTCAVVDKSGSMAGEDGPEVWENPFFSEECEDRDSWLPIGVVLELLLNVSPGGRNVIHTTVVYIIHHLNPDWNIITMTFVHTFTYPRGWIAIIFPWLENKTNYILISPGRRTKTCDQDGDHGEHYLHMLAYRS